MQKGGNTDKTDCFSCILWLCAAAAALAASVRLGIGALQNPGPGFLTFWSGILLAGLSGILLFQGRMKKAPATSTADLWTGRMWFLPAMAITAMVLYGLLLPLLGYIVATSGLMTFLFAMTKMKSRLMIPGALLAALLSFALFDCLLKMPFPRGLFGF